MTPMVKAKYSIVYSLLFVSIVCESFAAFGNNLKQTEPGNRQIAERDHPHEVLKKTLSASQSVKSYRVRIEIPSVSKVVTIMEYALPDRVRITEKKEVTLWIGKNIYRKEGDNRWKKYPDRTSDGYMWAKQLEEPSAVDTVVLPALWLENLIKSLTKAEDIKFIGQETIDGIPTLAYQHTMRSGARQNTMKTWIGVADGLLRRWEFECLLSGSTPSPVVYTYYDYNADIKIEPPTEADLAPAGVLSPPMALRGEDRGIGSGTGGGIGSGAGTGVGPGRGGGRGGGDFRSGGGDFNPDGSAKSVDLKPQALNRPPRPNYTEEARKNKIQGVVRARALVGADGEVKQVRVISGLPDGLNEEAILTVKQVRFKPAMKDGQPVAYWVVLEVAFNLR